MDDTLFNDEFRVFTDDKVEARYLLTPAFMKCLRVQDKICRRDGSERGVYGR